MKHKFSSMGRVAIALVLALSLVLVMATPVAATHTSTAGIDFQATESTVAGQASILDVVVTNDVASAGNINKVKIDFTDSDFTIIDEGTLPGTWTLDGIVGAVITYTDATGIAPDASVIFSPAVTNPAEAGAAVAPAVLTTDIGSAALVPATVASGWIGYVTDSLGSGTNAITVEYIDPEMVSQPLSVSVDGLAITVSLATDGESACISTATEVDDAIDGDGDAGALVDATVDGGHTDYTVLPLTVPDFTGGTSPDVDKVCTVTPGTLPVTPSFTATATPGVYTSAADTSYVISFTTLQLIEATTGTIVITFATEYDLTAVADGLEGDISMTVGVPDYTPATVVVDAVTDNDVTITADAAIAVGSDIVITIANDHIGNPAASGLYDIAVTGAGTDIDESTVIIVPAAFEVVAGALDTVTAGTPFIVTLQALNALEADDTGYTGLHFIDFSSTGTGQIPAFEEINFGAGEGTSDPANFILTVAGEANVTITATDSELGVSGVSETITINPQVFSELTIAGEPGTVIAGENFGTADITVTALNADGETVTDYAGTVIWTSSDTTATAGDGLPPNYTFTGEGDEKDNGTHTFPGSEFILQTVGDGTQTITVTDGGVSKISALITVTPATASQWTVVAEPDSITADGTDSSTITATVSDEFGNVDTNYSGTATFTTNLGDITTSGAMNFTDGVVENTLTSDGVVGTATIKVTSGTLPDKTVTVALEAPSLLTEVWVDDVTDVPWLNDPTHFGNISEAITAVAEGGTVNVAAGTYTEDPVIIGKSLTLSGPNANISPNTGTTRETEAIIAGQTSVEAGDDVTIQGFHFTVTPGVKTIDIPGGFAGDALSILKNSFTADPATDSDLPAIGVNPNNPIAGVVIDDNLITGVMGIFVNPQAAGSNVTISNNVIDGDPSTPAFAGISVDGVTGVISDNVIRNTGDAGINVGSGIGPCTGLTIRNNTVTNAGCEEWGNAGAINLYSDCTNITITGNTLADSWDGITIKGGFGALGSSIAINENNITGNSNYGIFNDADSGILDAEDNWWGDDTGPWNDTTNPDATGDQVSDGVDYRPWLDAAYSAPVDPVTTYDITLTAGWNLISLPLIPDAPDIDTMTASLTELEKIRRYDAGWLVYNPAMPFPSGSTLLIMEDDWGYWVKMEDPGTGGSFTFTGSELVADPEELPPSYDVVEGWNLIGFKSTTSSAIAAYLGGVSETLDAIYGYRDGAFFIPTDELEPGLGYWIAVTGPGTIYP